MLRNLVVFAFAMLLLSCNEDDIAAPLKEPPYDKITDSIRMDPENAELYYRRGNMLYDDDQEIFAAKDLRKAWELSPNEQYALRLLTLYKQKQPDTAIAFIHEALKKLPNSVALKFNLAKGYELKGQIEQALTVCDEIIAKFPGQLDALVLKAELLKQQNKTREAIAVLETAYTYAPDDLEVVYMLGLEYADSKNPKALELADSLIAVDMTKRHAEPFYFKGLYHENKGNYAEAIKFFDEAIGRNYNFIDAYMDKGQCYYDQKKYPDALKTFSLATTVSPTFADAYYWLAKTKEAMGDKQEAKLDYQRAYGLDKTLKEAKEAADRL